ncbi:hypothetical protein JYU34_018185 [Plutella xylostella]|uniref:Uncharacterized protein n=1 Tax=Plutella xylostella TaxID=51655 RepID=A0ABQ7Q1C8_PLUXY|nr:hypothetical protein JYU34_018185 [Plutella xylostella]
MCYLNTFVIFLLCLALNSAYHMSRTSSHAKKTRMTSVFSKPVKMAKYPSSHSNLRRDGSEDFRLNKDFENDGSSRSDGGGSSDGVDFVVVSLRNIYKDLVNNNGKYTVIYLI